MNRFPKHPDAAGNVIVRLDGEHWQAVLEAMHWDLPDTPVEKSHRAKHSERCFYAHRQIRHALGHHDRG